MAAKFGLKEFLTRVSHTAGVRGNAGVIRGQPDVILLRNFQWPPNLVTRTPDQSVTHC